VKENQKRIQEYFAKRVKCYEEAYSRSRPAGLMNTVYHFCWFPLRLIFSHTMAYLNGFDPKTVLDIGCGCGNYTVELASRGAAVTALDTCKEMAISTQDLANRAHLGGLIQTVHADYLEWVKEPNQKYDLILAIGLFDYVRDASEYLASFRCLSRDVIITFPADYPLSFLARFSYRQQGVPGYFYTREQIERLLRAAHFEIISFTKIFPSTYWVHGRQSATVDE
jgi:2-polyprenyl-3-methyl-5-hydroxy-6-metoxy-1,4-benzoquinol methylase